MPRAAIHLGPFDLHTPIGRGGMGQVWQASHRRQKVPAAIKFLAGRYTRDRWFHQAFKDEVRAVARLQHPAIVTVLDQGETPEEVARAVGGDLVEGAPWLAMDLVRGGTLGAWLGRLDWPQLRSVLNTLLDALAHAHARGVVHKDLKPSNVLVSRGPGAILKLTDFGIAQLASRVPNPSIQRYTGGTPAYMAPEQFADDESDVGPWTDLYSLGCLAVELSTGQPPYGRLTFDDAPSVLASRDLPRLRTEFPVPEEFEGWVRTLLAKDPTRRYRRAADATRALQELGLVFNLGGSLGGSARRGEDLGTDMETRPAGGDPAVQPEESQEDTQESSLPPPIDPRPPPLPAGWDHWDQPLPDQQLLGAGLGLYGVRTIPMVGRKQERDLLWAALRGVVDTGTPRCVVLRGAAGVGKTRLATWLGETADEVGVATFLVAEHGPFAEGAPGWPAMLARHLRCEEADPPTLRRRLGRFFQRLGVRDPGTLAAVSTLLDPAAAEQGWSLPASQRHALGARMMGWVAQERPVVVLLDDAQWSAEAIRFACHLLDPARAPLRLLLLLTVEEEALVEQQEVDRLLQDTLERPAVTTIHVPPLPPAECSLLLRGLLRLDADLSSRIETWMAGNPLSAVELVGEWIDRGLLVPGTGGFALARGARFELPDDLLQFWSARVDHLQNDLGESSVRAFEVAAALGGQVRFRDWIATCRLRGLEASRSLAQELENRRLAVLSDATWRFVNPLLRGSLERRARLGGRWEDINRTCARILPTLWAQGPHGVGEQVARHLVESGELEMALEPLRKAVHDRVEAEEYSEAQRLLHRRAGLLATLGLPADDPRVAENDLLRADLAQRRGSYDEALHLLEQVDACTRSRPLSGLRADALLVRARIHYQRSERQEARALLEEAVPLFEAAGDLLGLAHARYMLGRIVGRAGETSGARALVEQAIATFEGRNPHGKAQALVVLGQLDLLDGALEAAAGHDAEALAIMERIGSPFGLAWVLNEVGEVARARGDLDAASQAYRQAREIFEQLGSPQYFVPAINQGVVDVERGQMVAARQAAEALLPRLQKLGWRAHVGFIHGILVACNAAHGTEEEFATHLDQAISLTRGRVEHDLPRCLQVAGSAAWDAGHLERARVAWSSALCDWRILGRTAEARRVEAWLDRISDLEGSTDRIR